MGALSAYCPTLSILLQAARQYQQTPEFRQRYATRAGVEGSIPCCSIRARAIGLAKTQLQHIITATAMNLVRLGSWWNQVPKHARVSALPHLSRRFRGTPALISPANSHELRAPAPMKMW